MNIDLALAAYVRDGTLGRCAINPAHALAGFYCPRCAKILCPICSRKGFCRLCRGVVSSFDALIAQRKAKKTAHSTPHPRPKGTL